MTAIQIFHFFFQFLISVSYMVQMFQLFPPNLFYYLYFSVSHTNTTSLVQTALFYTPGLQHILLPLHCHLSISCIFRPNVLSPNILLACKSFYTSLSQILTSVSILLSFPPVCSSPFFLPSHYTLVFEPSIILFHVPSKVSGRPL